MISDGTRFTTQSCSSLDMFPATFIYANFGSSHKWLIGRQDVHISNSHFWMKTASDRQLHKITDDLIA